MKEILSVGKLIDRRTRLRAMAAAKEKFRQAEGGFDADRFKTPKTGMFERGTAETFSRILELKRGEQDDLMIQKGQLAHLKGIEERLKRAEQLARIDLQPANIGRN
jgi:hypothetical protein